MDEESTPTPRPPSATGFFINYFRFSRKYTASESYLLVVTYVGLVTVPFPRTVPDELPKILIARAINCSDDSHLPPLHHQSLRPSPKYLTLIHELHSSSTNTSSRTMKFWRNKTSDIGRRPAVTSGSGTEDWIPCHSCHEYVIRGRQCGKCGAQN